ncbi:hypothetical protein ACFOU2_21345 [Bacillus songklensis]|uniref:Uncharacterized protein n=1 Tax=Bacillus songklensis TaxID=1069116 RepID=A0ABV8B7L6_9BACI
MPIITLLEHLKNTKKRPNILVGPVTLNNAIIDSYSINSDVLWILTDQENEIEVNIEDFRKIDFDAIVSEAETSIEMIRCFYDLAESTSYNAYLRDFNNRCIISFHDIPADY